MRPRSQRACGGFTVLELMVTMLVSAIVMAMAVPSFTNSIRNTQLTTQIFNVAQNLSYARSEAIKRGVSVVVCTSSTGTACSGSSSWEAGWIVFVDSNGNGSVDAGEPILKVVGALPANYTLRPTTSGATSTAFGSNGVANAVFGLALCKNLTLAPSRAAIISSTGRVYVSTVDSNLVAQGPTGADLTTCTP